MKLCPFCAESIQDAAIKCKHCGSMLADASQTLPPSRSPLPATPQPVPPRPSIASTFVPGTCPYCQKKVSVNAFWCVHCKRDLPRTEFTPRAVSLGSFVSAMKQKLTPYRAHWGIALGALFVVSLIGSIIAPTRRLIAIGRAFAKTRSRRRLAARGR